MSVLSVCQKTLPPETFPGLKIFLKCVSDPLAGLGEGRERKGWVWKGEKGENGRVREGRKGKNPPKLKLWLWRGCNNASTDVFAKLLIANNI